MLDRLLAPLSCRGGPCRASSLRILTLASLLAGGCAPTIFAEVVNGPYILLEDVDRISLRVEVDQVGYRFRVFGAEDTATDVLPEFRRSEQDTFLAIGLVDLARHGPLVAYELWRGRELIARFAWKSSIGDPALVEPRILIFGDSQGGASTLARHAAQWEQEKFDLLVGLGDLVDFGSNYGAWREEVFKPLASTLPHRPVLVVCGNHEAYRDRRLYWFDWYFGRADGRRYFEVEFPDLRLIGINNADLHTKYGFDPIEPLTPQYQFLLRSLFGLRNNLGKKTMVFSHVPMFSGSTVVNREYGSESQRRHLLPLLRQAGVTAFLSGHHHKFERVARPGPWGEMSYVVSGGGGGGLFPTPDQQEGYMMDREIFEQFHYLVYESGSTVFLVKTIKGEVIDKIPLRRSAGRGAGNNRVAFWRGELGSDFKISSPTLLGPDVTLAEPAERRRLTRSGEEASPALIREDARLMFFWKDPAGGLGCETKISLQGYDWGRRAWGYLQGASVNVDLGDYGARPLVIGINGSSLAPLDRMYPVKDWPVAGVRAGVGPDRGAILLLRGWTNFDFDPAARRIVAGWAWGGAAPEDVAPRQVERQLGVLRTIAAPIERADSLPREALHRLRACSSLNAFLIRTDSAEVVATLVYWTEWEVLAVVLGPSLAEASGALYFTANHGTQLSMQTTEHDRIVLSIGDEYWVPLQ